MVPGAYHFLRAGDGAAQARHFLNRITAHGGPTGWIIQLDAESDGYGSEMTAWANEWNRLTGNYPFLIYSGSWSWPHTNNVRGAGLTANLWHPHYVSGTDLGSVLYQQVTDGFWKPGYGGWEQATVLQFSDRGQVAGAAIDVSAYRGTADQLRAALTRPSTALVAHEVAAPETEPRAPPTITPPIGA
jgi:hypothetical protein